MAVFETVLVSDLKKPIQVKQLTGNLFSGDNGGNKITVEVLDGGSAATLSGTVTGYILRADNATVTVTGTLSGNKASITLPASAYAVIGAVSIVVKLGTTTLGACTSYVYRTTTDTIVDPGSVVPDISELLAIIGDCETATAAANTAAIGAGYVNIAMSKSGDTITITTTNRNNQQTTVTMTDYTVATTTETEAIITEYEG
jgi:hypothetical protein